MSRIDELDLRPEAMILAEEVARGNERIERALDKMWDWPSAPWFANTRVTVTITADTSKFKSQLAGLAKTFTFLGYNQAHASIYAKMALEQMHAMGRLASLGETVQGGEIRWKPWQRWNVSENWPWYSLTIGLSLALGFVLGVWPWL